MSERSLIELRAKLKDLKINAFVVGSEDAHQSEYVCEADMRRQFISGFKGSAGTALILQDQALLWTDGRYFLQAEMELSSSWTLMKAGLPGVPDMTEFLLKTLTEGQSVGVDPWLLSASSAFALEKTLAKKNIRLVSVSSNPVDEVWSKCGGRPAYPLSALEIIPEGRAGEAVASKMAKVRASLGHQGASGVLVSMLDEICWLFNLRGGDVEFNPVAIAYTLLTLDEAYLFIDQRKLSVEVSAYLQQSGILVRDYTALDRFLPGLKTILVDSSKVNYRLYRLLQEADGVQEGLSPVTLAKAVKHPAELASFKAVHVVDGVALTAFLHWLEKTIRAGERSYSEYEVAMELERFRSRMPGHRGPSFATIAGYGSNGAVIHYKPEASTSLSLQPASLFLLDSGAQYCDPDGTTDVTRTLCLGGGGETQGCATAEMRRAYTAVLQGHIALASLIFPEGCLGSRIDSIARLSLWRQGLDYLHGTGHGVGIFLNVHEGPQGIGFRRRDNEAGLLANMTMSNEPGYYADGQFGIRIENLCVTVVKAEAKEGGKGPRYLGFETVTLVPIKLDLVDLAALTTDEQRWIDDYHQQVRASLLPGMKEHFPDSVDYLLQETRSVAAQLDNGNGNNGSSKRKFEG